MSLHELLSTAETALVWSFVAGCVASSFARRPVRTLMRLLAIHAHHQQQIADKLDTQTDGGISDVVRALKDVGPSPQPARKAHGRS